MASIGTPMLFLPPFPPIALGPGRMLLGRSPSCDLTLPSPDASRRHAEIVAVASGYVVRDLGSTNGTFVNGERIEEHALRPGDRVQIGGEALTFCQLDPGLESVDSGNTRGEAQTEMIERPTLGECIRGNLAEIPPFAVLQILEMGRKTGVLQIETQDGPGRLWLVDGVPVHALTKLRRGFDAAIAVVNAASGHFTFEPGRQAPERSLDTSVTELLLEASRQLDEASS